MAAFFAITIAEWFIHLPLFNVLLGWPLQFLGLAVAPALFLRYYGAPRPAGAPPLLPLLP